MKAASPRAHAIRLLARREYARAELEQKLLAQGWERKELRVALDELTAAGYLSDSRYARSLAAQKAGRYSRRSITSELKAKGIGQPEIDSALAEANVDDEATMKALWERRFGHAPADERDKARQVRFLQARGFALSAILKLLRAVERGELA